MTLELEPLREDLPRYHLTMEIRLLLEESEG